MIWKNSRNFSLKHIIKYKKVVERDKVHSRRFLKQRGGMRGKLFETCKRFSHDVTHHLIQQNDSRLQLLLPKVNKELWQLFLTITTVDSSSLKTKIQFNLNLSSVRCHRTANLYCPKFFYIFTNGILCNSVFDIAVFAVNEIVIVSHIQQNSTFIISRDILEIYSIWIRKRCQQSKKFPNSFH